jgi:hypothetical protein
MVFLFHLFGILTNSKPENTQRRAQAKEKEEGRLARIRDNNARVEATNDAFQNKLTTENTRRVATVKRQQENYAQVLFPSFSLLLSLPLLQGLPSKIGNSNTTGTRRRVM